MEIVLWYNNPPRKLGIFKRKQLTKFKNSHLVRKIFCDHNFGIIPRFTLASCLEGEYVCIFDDDTIPGIQWFENCLKYVDQERAILGTIGLKYKSWNKKVIIEEPLLNSNNVYTVGTLLRYNSMVLKSCFDILGVVPNFISTYNARKFAFPDLVGKNIKGRNVLFGGYPKDIDKKHVVWEHVNDLFPEVEWGISTRTGNLKKENYDMSDAATAVIGYINKIKSEKT